MMAAVEKNPVSQVYKGYEVEWDDDGAAATEILHKLTNPYDFIGVNKVVSDNIAKQKAAEERKGGGANKQQQIAVAQDNYDDFDAAFADYEEPGSVKKAVSKAQEMQLRQAKMAPTVKMAKVPVVDDGRF